MAATAPASLTYFARSAPDADARKAAWLTPPQGWRTIQGDGYLMHADQRKDDPLAFALAVAQGLDDDPRWLDARFLYDAQGSVLFEKITQQIEYYQTRTEAALLRAHAHELRDLSGGVPLVELGCGSARKTEILLDAWSAQGQAAYLPCDVSTAALEEACTHVLSCHPGLHVEAIAACYDRALDLVRGFGPKLLTFLGSSMGNLGRDQHDEFLSWLAGSCRAGDLVLLGLDLVKDPHVLEAAYDDAAQVTAAFTRNLFARMNRELGTQVPLDAVRHVAYYNERRERIEIFAEFQREVLLALPRLGREFRLARGERIRTEISYKYRPETAIAMMERFGFAPALQVTDEARSFGLFLFRQRPSPGSRVAPDAARLEALLERVRRRTLDIVAPLDETTLKAQHSRLMSPLLWDLGHVANVEAQWLVGARSSVRPRSMTVLDVDVQVPPLDPRYDPQNTPRDRRGELDCPDLRDTRRYMDGVRDDVRRRLRAGDANREDQLGRHGFVWHLVAQHESQHQETMLQAIALRESVAYRPGFTSTQPPACVAPVPEAPIVIPSGTFLMGTNDESWAYDNELPAHEIDLPAYRIDPAPVTNGTYQAFMEDGGYLRRELWSEDGWRWRQDEGAVAPGHWRRTSEGWRALVFGQLAAIDRQAPVVHVSWYEADAFARWAGKRLPSEAEWEKAAAWDPVRGVSRPWPWADRPGATDDPRRANLDQRLLTPAPVGSYPAGRSFYGCHQMLGDVWEWTSSWFQPYPGFRPFPYVEASAAFFGNTYRVLRGGSFATSSLVARTTFRNWDHPQRRQIFAGFRCACDVA